MEVSAKIAMGGAVQFVIGRCPLWDMNTVLTKTLFLLVDVDTHIMPRPIICSQSGILLTRSGS